MAAFDSDENVPMEGAQLAWRHVVSLCAFVPPGEQPLLRMFDGEVLLLGGGNKRELPEQPPAGLLLAACTSQ